jgi:hypothetical protein
MEECFKKPSCPFISQFIIGMNQCLTLQEYLENLSFLCLGANKGDLLHVTRCIVLMYYFLVEIYLFQHDI